MPAKLALCCILHDDVCYVRESVRNPHLSEHTFGFISTVAWHGVAGQWQKAVQALLDLGTHVVTGEWHSELAHRQASQEWLLEQGFTHALIPDGDEILEPQLLDALVHIAENELADRVYVEWDTYWKSPEYVIRPRERFTPCMLIDLRKVTPVGGRNFEGGRPLFLSAEHGIVHHLSYVGPDARIRRKLETWGHANEVVAGWWENVWKRWDSDKLMRNLHPTHPQAYGFAERIHVPDILLPALARYNDLALEAGEAPASLDAEQFRFKMRSGWPTVSVIIPVHGGREDLGACLASLDACRDLLHEVIVVDNGSPDHASKEAERYPFARILRNETNTGFAHASNQGLEATTGEVVLFLNSDTVAPRSGLVRLIESLMASGTIAAAGPYTNNSGHFQKIEPTYTSLDTLDLFADGFAVRTADDVDTDMLVGFCLAVKRSALDELGDFDERFGLGTFEDNDLCYRLRRAGYRLVIASRSFVHHVGSASFRRMETNVSALLATNQRLYMDKWKEDLESGYASTLSGLSPECIVFRPERQPEKRRGQMAELARRADISLCMIVKDEERVLDAALASAKPFFREIVVVDTGSTDRTVEIAEAAGARVFSFPWTESFADARNESLQHATGKWVFWMDADDTLPLASGEALLQAALNAGPDTMSFVVPVQFVDDGSDYSSRVSGTRVDHVKLFRNLPGLAFEGRIHEQILPSLRRLRPEGQVARCNAVVLHSGYDTSDAGQKKKRERDYKLLELDQAERPEHPFVLFNFGMTDHYCGHHVSAVEWLRKSIAASEPAESHLRKAYALMAVSLRELGRREEGRHALEEGLARVGSDPELHFHLANLATEDGNYEEALRHFEAVLGADTTSHFSSLDIGILGFKTFHNRANVHKLLGDYKAARSWWNRSIEAAPEFLPSTFLLFGAALEHGDYHTAKQMLERVRAAEGASENWARMGVQLARELAIGGGGPLNGAPVPGGAEEEFLRDSVMRAPDATGPRLELARLLLQTCREGEAEPHLHVLKQQGVAEAAYFLGVMAIRAGDLASALARMEQAHALNPNHLETHEQIGNLRQALSLGEVRASPTPPIGPAVSLHEALAQVAQDLGLDASRLIDYAAEDQVGGYKAGPSSSGMGCGEVQVDDGLRDSAEADDASAATPEWPGGSVWEAEGRVLYALVRALKPRTIVEVGSLIGCSTSHLAAACKKNGYGRVYAVDPALDFSRVDKSLLPFITPVKEDVFGWTPPEPIDLLFEDGAHTPGFTRKVLTHLGPHLAPSAVALCHDFRHGEYGLHIGAEFSETLSARRLSVGSVLIAPANCGLGYAWRGSDCEAPAVISVPDSGPHDPDDIVDLPTPTHVSAGSTATHDPRSDGTGEPDRDGLSGSAEVEVATA